MENKEFYLKKKLNTGEVDLSSLKELNIDKNNCKEYIIKPIRGKKGRILPCNQTVTIELLGYGIPLPFDGEKCKVTAPKYVIDLICKQGFKAVSKSELKNKKEKISENQVNPENK